MFEELKKWHKGIIIGLGLCLVFYFFQLMILLYKDYVFSSFNKKAGFAYFYSLPDAGTMILVFVFFIVACGVTGYVLDFRKINDKMELKNLSKKKKD